MTTGGGTGVLDPLFETFASPLMRRALLEGVLVGSLCGVVGVHVVLRRLPFFTMALGHAVFPGLVLAEITGLSLVVGALGFGLVVVAAVGWLGATEQVDETNAVGVVLAGAFALGVLLVSSQPGFSRDLTSFLVGAILTVGTGDILLTAAVAALVLAVLGALHKELVMGAFDPAGLRALGYPVRRLDLVVLAVVAATVVSAVPAVGTILAVALLVTPAATARLWADRVGPTMAVAAGVGAASAAGGLAASHHWGIAAGGAIVLVGAGLFVLSLVLAPYGWAGGLLRRLVGGSAARARREQGGVSR